MMSVCVCVSCVCMCTCVKLPNTIHVYTSLSHTHFFMFFSQPDNVFFYVCFLFIDFQCITTKPLGKQWYLLTVVHIVTQNDSKVFHGVSVF